jgi:hypothetical protein
MDFTFLRVTTKILYDIQQIELGGYQSDVVTYSIQLKQHNTIGQNLLGKLVLEPTLLIDWKNIIYSLNNIYWLRHRLNNGRRGYEKELHMNNIKNMRVKPMKHKSATWEK